MRGLCLVKFNLSHSKCDLPRRFVGLIVHFVDRDKASFYSWGRTDLTLSIH